MTNINTIFTHVIATVNTNTHADLRELMKTMLVKKLAWGAASSKLHAKSMDPMFRGRPNQFTVSALEEADAMQSVVLGVGADMHLDRKRVVAMMGEGVQAVIAWETKKALGTAMVDGVKVTPDSGLKMDIKGIMGLTAHIDPKDLEYIDVQLDLKATEKTERKTAALGDLKPIEATLAPMVGGTASPCQSEGACIHNLMKFLTFIESYKETVDTDLRALQRTALDPKTPKTGPGAKRIEKRAVAKSSLSLALVEVAVEFEGLIEWLLDRKAWLMTPAGERIDADLKQIDNALDGWGGEEAGNIGGQSDNNDRS